MAVDLCADLADLQAQCCDECQKKIGRMVMRWTRRGEWPTGFVAGQVKFINILANCAERPEMEEEFRKWLYVLYRRVYRDG